jgi:hypothetical protein
MRSVRLLVPIFVMWSVAAHAGEIVVSYVPPKNPAHEPILTSLKKHEALEKLQQVFSPFQLPQTIHLRTIGCDGQPNAWYHLGTISVCYEYLAEARKRVPDKGPVRRQDALIGQFFYVFAHEFGHAVFDMLGVPVFGRAEDAADQFAAYVMLQFNKDDARRLVHGAAYTYKDAVSPGSSAASRDMFKMYSDAHGTPEQRMYNLLCMAYGADAQTFGALVKQGYLPKPRAAGCRREYGEVRYAFLKLIAPHVDQAAAKLVMERTWLPRESEVLPAVSGGKANR